MGERFWSKVNVCGDDECWEWTAGKYRRGYGSCSAVFGNRYAHRVAWTLTNGEIPVGLCVLHHCDNPPCCNPAHLFIGTQSDNMKDKAGKGRATRGESCRHSRLTEIDIKLIRMWLKRGYTQRSIADVFEISRQSIGDINTGRTWKHVREV